MNRIVFQVLVSVIFVSCLSGINKKSNEDSTIIKSSSRNIEVRSDLQDSTLTKEHAFSHPDKKDTFKLSYNCNNLEDSMMFQIITSSGKCIYKKKFSGTSFYDYSRPWYIYVSATERGDNFDPNRLSRHIADSLHRADLVYIRKRMNSFFSAENFITNPISKLDKEMLNISDYRDITGDSTVIGFSYRLWAGGGFEMIAYSKKLQKVKLIAASD